jgi:hypothetical protein
VGARAPTDAAPAALLDAGAERDQGSGIVARGDARDVGTADAGVKDGPPDRGDVGPPVGAEGMCPAGNDWAVGVDKGPPPTGKSCRDFCQEWLTGGKGGQGCWMGVSTARVYRADTAELRMTKCLADCVTFSPERLCCRMAYVLRSNAGGIQDILCQRALSACP